MAEYTRCVLEYLPSRKILIITSIFIAGVLLVTALSSKSPASKEQQNKVIYNVGNSEAREDSDKDGTPDWQEILAGSDPRDATSKPTAPTDGKSASGLDPNTENGGGSLTNDALKAYAQLIQSQYPNGTDSFDRETLELNENTRKLLADNMLEAAEVRYKKSQTYSASDALIDPNETARNYFNNVALVVGKYFSRNTGDPQYASEVGVLTDIGKKVESGAPKEEVSALLQKLLAFRYRYVGSAADLKKLRVPPGRISGVHVRLVNSFSATAEILNEISEMETDPLLAAIGYGHYSRETLVANAVYLEMKKIVNENKIAYRSDEAGFLFQSYTP